MRPYSRRHGITKKFLATGLSLSALAQLVPPTAPASAQAVPAQALAGSTIQNRATGTYQDPNNPGVILNATSNTVTVTVAKVAGITNVPAGIIDRNAGSVSTNDILDFDFLVTNTGNHPTNIFFPAIAQMLPVGFNITGYQLDLNNDGDFLDGVDETTVRTAAFTTGTPIPANGSVRVRVSGTVTPTTAGAPVSVRLGDTAPNDNSAATQNQPDVGPLGDDQASDVRTITVNTPVTGAPVNGEREAAAIQSTTVAAAVNNQALATILKTQTAYAPNLPAPNFADDVLTYGLDLRVETTPPAPGISPAPLAPTVNVNIDTVNRDVILISDAIPANTRLNAVPTAPTGWRVVYSVTPVAPVGNFATTATWTTTAPALNTVNRIGFIYDPDANLATASPSITPGTSFTGFSFSVVTGGLTTAAGGSINNIAQVFGRTDGTTREVYDESGDQRPSNFNDDGTPNAADDPATPGREDVNNGVADPANQGTDNLNNNTGSGPGGEVNVFTISPAGNILNGPAGVPAAVGPNSNQDDFTNRSTPLPAANSVPGTTFDPAPITFNNTFQNPPSSVGNLDTVRLLPLPPNNAQIPLGSRQELADIPNGTRVTITLGTQVAVYDYNAGVYTLNAGLSSGLPIGSNTILVNGVAPGTSLNYTVAVDLPVGTALSADRFTAALAADAQRRAGFNVPIVAFVDNTNNGVFDAAVGPNQDTVFNITIDRLYTGYVRLRKQSQIIRGGALAPGADGTLSEAAKTVQPGDIIRYVVEYVNFSTPSAGTGNVTLTASELEIIEDGNLAPNNWANTTVHFNSAVVVDGSAQNTFATLGSIRYNGLVVPDPATGTPVSVYRNEVGTIIPATDPAVFQGLFRFHRRVN